MWNYLCCPACNHTWTFGLKADPAPSSPNEDLWNLNNLFSQLDQFCAQILSVPAAANHPDVRKQIDFLKASKDKLRLAQSEELVRRNVREAQMAQFRQRFKQEEEALRKKRDEVNKPAPPLDGNALGQALVKDLGLSGNEAVPPKAGPAPTPRTDQDLLDMLAKKGLIERPR
jgi:hypothetical protein